MMGGHLHLIADRSSVVHPLLVAVELVEEDNRAERMCAVLK